MSDNDIADVLYRAADLIEPEGAWTQFVGSRDRYGNEVCSEAARDPEAVCWCIGGALFYVTMRPIPRTPAAHFLDDLLGGFVAWNDAPERTQAEVVAKLREAAALARKKVAKSTRPVS